MRFFQKRHRKFHVRKNYLYMFIKGFFIICLTIDTLFFDHDVYNAYCWSSFGDAVEILGGTLNTVVDCDCF